MFKIGDWAEWDVKNGTVRAECIAVVPEGQSFNVAIHMLKIKPHEFSMNGDGAYAARKHESYIFAGPIGPRGGKRKLYWPKVEKLRKVVK